MARKNKGQPGRRQRQIEAETRRLERENQAMLAEAEADPTAPDPAPAGYGPFKVPDSIGGALALVENPSVTVDYRDGAYWVTVDPLLTSCIVHYALMDMIRQNGRSSGQVVLDYNRMLNGLEDWANPKSSHQTADQETGTAGSTRTDPGGPHASQLPGPGHVPPL